MALTGSPPVLSGSLLLSNFAYTALDRLTGPLLGSHRRCHDDALYPALSSEGNLLMWVLGQTRNREPHDHVWQGAIRVSGDQIEVGRLVLSLPKATYQVCASLLDIINIVIISVIVVMVTKITTTTIITITMTIVIFSDWPRPSTRCAPPPPCQYANKFEGNRLFETFNSLL